MNKEIERKFLLKNDSWRNLAKGTLYKQGYLTTHKDRTVRVRIIGNNAFLTIKGASMGPERLEFEYPLPINDAELLISLCEKPIIEKERYRIKMQDITWEIDDFYGENKGLVIAEVELKSADQLFIKPDWIGEEVTDDVRYFNANLVKNPFSKW